MLWTLLKIVVFVAIVAAVALGAGWLMQSDLALRLVFAGWEITLRPLQAAIAVLLLVLAVWLLIRLAGLVVAVLRFILGDETALSRYFTRNRERRGLRALAEGMTALAGGEGQTALLRARKAERLLGATELTDPFLAQAAEAAGDRAAAKAALRRMVGEPRTRLAGLRGLLRQKLAEGDTEAALKLAQRAFALKPGHAEIQDRLIELQTQAGAWGEARRTLAAKHRHGSLPRDVHRRRDAVLALAEARSLKTDERDDAAHERALEANRLAPALVPAAVMAAEGLAARGRQRAAARALRTAWEAEPHPDLATAFAALAPDEAPEARRSRFRALTERHPDHPETRMLKAELAIAAEDFPAARRALGDMPETAPSARALALMAATERGLGESEAVVRGWLTRALAAPRGPQWLCARCGTVHEDWAPICRHCGSFDSLAWKEAPQGASSLPHAAEMLPILVSGGGDAGSSEGAAAPGSGAATERN